MLRPDTAYPAGAGVTEWRVLVTVDGVPCARLRLPDPGPGAGPAYLDATVRRAAAQHVDYEAALALLRARLDPRPRPQPPPLTTSVVVCTHRRPDDVAVLLGALRALDPPPDEIVIVDNAPGEQDCRAQVAAAGARYVREDRVGLDHARRTGLLAATGEIVCFTDDDCAPATHWLRRLPELFADPSVGAVTGPGFARELATASQVRFEDSGGFSRGLRPRYADWRSLSPLRSTAMGAGANMCFRRELLLGLGDVFPAELDAGTPTQSGGDMIALYRVLAAGLRIVYDPSTYIVHRHRRDPRSLHHGMWGYGVGLAAALTKLLVREREPGAITAWTWLWEQYREAVKGRWRGDVDAVEQRIAWDYLRGGLVGPWAWWRSRGLEEPPPPAPAAAPAPAAPAPASSPATPASAPPAPAANSAAPAFSVIVATRDRPRALSRCLAALGAQDPVDGGFEVLVVDDDPAATAAIPQGLALPVRLVRSGGAGAAGARNAGAREARGEHVLFLDDDLVPAADLVARHLAAHRALGGDAMVIGICPPAPASPGLAAQAAALWWNEHYRAKADAPALMFADVLSGNASLPRALFERLGGFDAEFASHRREDWDFGVRVLRAGVRAVHAPDAVATHEFALSTRGAIAAAQREGGGDALLAARWPEVAATLPPRAAGRRRLDPRGPGSALLEPPRAQRMAAVALDVLERLRARRHWLALFHRTREAAYARARREAGVARDAPATARRPQVLTVDLAAAEPIVPPAVAAPVVVVRFRGRRLGSFRPVDGQWAATNLAFSMLDLADPAIWAELARPSPPAQAGGRAWAVPAHETVHLAAAPRDAAARRALAARVASCESDVVVLALRGRKGFALPAGALDAFASPRVGLAFGGRGGETALGPVYVYSREVPFGGRGLPRAQVEYLAVRPGVLARAGGLEAWAGGLEGDQLARDLVERALAAGHHVAWQDLPGPPPPPLGTRGTWRRDRSAGADAARRMVARGGPAGVLALLRAAPWSWHPTSLAFHGAAFAAGAVAALRRPAGDGAPGSG